MVAGASRGAGCFRASEGHILPRPAPGAASGTSAVVGPGTGTESDNAFSFRTEFREVLKIDTSGNFYVNGKLVAEDKEVYDALVAFLRGTGVLARPLTPSQNVILHGDPMAGGLSRFDIAKKNVGPR